MANLISKILLLLFPLFLFAGCVDSIIDDTAGKPSITVYTPNDGDSVQVGQNTIIYEANDYSGGSGISYYDIYINDTFIESISQNDDGTNPILYLNVPSNVIHTEISYYVIVYNTSGQYTQSDTKENIYVRDAIPLPPENLTLTKISDFAINLLWDDVSDNESSFEVWRQAGLTTDYSLLIELPANTISVNDYNLSPAIEYFYKVRSKNESGVSEFCNAVNTSSVIGLWNLQAEAIGASAIRLTWVDFIGIEYGFRIQRTNPYSGEWENLIIVPPNTTEYYDYEVQESTTYRYRVAYYTNSSVSGWSNEASASTFHTDESPPLNFTVTNLGVLGGSATSTTYSLEFTWTNNSDNEEGTSIEYKTSPGGTFKLLTEADTDDDNINVSLEVNNSELPAVYSFRARYILGTKVYSVFSDEVDLNIP